MKSDLMNTFLCTFDFAMSERHGEVAAKGTQRQIVAL